ncbi:hypothetical protein EDEG_02666, partial [Edhazardia aedis USNM 41457]
NTITVIFNNESATAEEQSKKQLENFYMKMVSAVNPIKKTLKYIESLKEFTESASPVKKEELLRYTENLESFHNSFNDFLPHFEFFESIQIKTLSLKLDNDFNELINGISSLHKKFYLEEFFENAEFIDDLNVLIEYMREKQNSNSHIAGNDKFEKSLKNLEDNYKAISNGLKTYTYVDLSSGGTFTIEMLSNMITFHNERIHDTASTFLSFKNKLKNYIEKYNSIYEIASSKKYISFKDFILRNISEIILKRGSRTEQNKKVYDNLVKGLLKIHSESFFTVVKAKIEERLHEHKSQFLKTNKSEGSESNNTTAGEISITDAKTTTENPDKAVEIGGSATTISTEAEIENLCKIMSDFGKIYEDLKNLKSFFVKIQEIHEYIETLYAKSNFLIFRRNIELQWLIDEAKKNDLDLEKHETLISEQILPFFSDIFETLQPFTNDFGWEHDSNAEKVELENFLKNYRNKYKTPLNPQEQSNIQNKQDESNSSIESWESIRKTIDACYRRSAIKCNCILSELHSRFNNMVSLPNKNGFINLSKILSAISDIMMCFNDDIELTKSSFKLNMPVEEADINFEQNAETHINYCMKKLINYILKHNNPFDKMKLSDILIKEATDPFSYDNNKIACLWIKFLSLNEKLQKFREKYFLKKKRACNNA